MDRRTRLLWPAHFCRSELFSTLENETILEFCWTSDVSNKAFDFPKGASIEVAESVSMQMVSQVEMMKTLVCTMRNECIDLDVRQSYVPRCFWKGKWLGYWS